MDSSQKMLKEMSDLTRNLDVLSREIREMNKISYQNQKDSAKTLKVIEKSGKVRDESKKNYSGTNQNPKEKKPNTEKNQETILSFTDKGNINPDNGERKSDDSILDILGLQNTSKKEIRSQESRPNLVETPKDLGEAYLRTQTESLKNKEKLSSEEEEKIEKSEKYLKEKEHKEKSKESKKSSEFPVLSKRDESKGFFEKLMMRISPNKEEKPKEFVVPPSPKVESEKPRKKKETESKKDENKVFFPNLTEKMRPEKKKEEDLKKSPITESVEKKPSLEIKEKPLTEKSPTKNPSVEPIIKPLLKDQAKKGIKKEYETSRLGKSVLGIKSLVNSLDKKEESPVVSKIQKEIPELKSPTQKEIRLPSTSGNKNPETIEPKSPSRGYTSSSTSPTITSPPEKLTVKKNQKNSADKSPALSSKDVKEIKDLLSSINSSLRSPLMMENSKPLRPKSNMLE